MPSARRLLQSEIAASRGRRVPADSAARLRYAYADRLLEAGDREAAHTWFAAAAKLDTDGVTDADERVARLEGLVIDFDDAEEADPEPGTSETGTSETGTSETEPGDAQDRPTETEE